jgi:VIT1/CCC1 family predicted Fe2+/Mn2+ transporter
MREVPERELAEVREILTDFGLDDAQSQAVGKALQAHPERWVDFMMRFELGLEPPDPGRARQSAFTIGGAYVVGGLIPLLPYMLLRTMSLAVASSVVVTLLALLVFGAVKARFTGIDPRKGALQTALIGGLAAGAAFGIASLLH